METTTKFVDAQEMHKNNPDTFDAPDNDELNAIKVGSTVKVCNERERFWVTVTGVDGEKITGEVNNNLLDNDEYDLGDPIVFEKKHIYDIYI